MSTSDLVSDHYSQNDLGSRIEAGFVAAGIEIASITTDELAMVDEFHTGGSPATVHLQVRPEVHPPSASTS